MAEKQTNKDRMREIVDSIENGIKELFESDTTRKAKSCWMAVLLTAAPLKIRRLHLLPGLSERRYLPFRA